MKYMCHIIFYLVEYSKAHKAICPSVNHMINHLNFNEQYLTEPLHKFSSRRREMNHLFDV